MVIFYATVLIMNEFCNKVCIMFITSIIEKTV